MIPLAEAAGAPAPASAAAAWNQAWLAARQRTGRRRGRESWDQRAPAFARDAGKSGYAGRLLELLRPEPDWEVLDVGCGAGTLALPLASRVRAVTAVDYSSRMLELLGERCAAAGVANVTPRLGAWEDDWAGLGLGRYDLAIASRSLTTDDLRGALQKLDAAARRLAVVVAPVGEGPIDGRVFAAVGRPFVAGPDYLYAYNLLHALGRYASVTFVENTDARRYPSREAAVEGLLWMIADPTDAEVARLRAWLDRELVPADGGWRLARPRTVRWAVLTWTPGAD